MVYAGVGMTVMGALMQTVEARRAEPTNRDRLVAWGQGLAITYLMIMGPLLLSGILANLPRSQDFSPRDWILRSLDVGLPLLGIGTSIRLIRRGRLRHARVAGRQGAGHPTRGWLDHVLDRFPRSRSLARPDSMVGWLLIMAAGAALPTLATTSFPFVLGLLVMVQVTIGMGRLRWLKSFPVAPAQIWRLVARPCVLVASLGFLIGLPLLPPEASPWRVGFSLVRAHAVWLIIELGLVNALFVFRVTHGRSKLLRFAGLVGLSSIHALLLFSAALPSGWILILPRLDAGAVYLEVLWGPNPWIAALATIVAMGGLAVSRFLIWQKVPYQVTFGRR